MRIHIVKKGDTLYQLSKKYNVPLDKLIEMNPQIADPDKLDIGMKVKVPSTSDLSPVPVDAIAHKHVVKQGDTLWKLSKQWGIPLQTMIDANPQLKNPSILMTGQVINIPKVNEQGQMMHTSSLAANVQQQNVPPHKKDTAPMPEMISAQEVEENVQPLQEEVVEEIKEELKEIKEEKMPEKIEHELKDFGKSLQQNLEEGIVENIKENIQEQAKQSVEKSVAMNENLPVLPEMQAAPKELSQSVKPLAAGKEQHTSSSAASYTEHPFEQYNVPATQAYSAYPNMQWAPQPQVYSQQQVYSSNVSPMTANTSMYAMNMQAPAKKKDDCGCGGGKAAHHKSPGMAVPYSQGGYPGLGAWTDASANAYPSLTQPYSGGWSNTAANTWMPESYAAGWESANSQANVSSSALGNISPGSFAPYANQGAVPYANQGAVPYANQGAVPYANQGAVPYANQGAVPYANQGAVPYANQGAVPYANQGAVPYANQGAVPYANQGAMFYGMEPWPGALQAPVNAMNMAAGMNTSSHSSYAPYSVNAAANTHLSGGMEAANVSGEKAKIHLSGTANTAANTQANSQLSPMTHVSGFGGTAAYANSANWGAQPVIPYSTPIGGEWGQWSQWSQANTAASQANVNAAAANSWANPAPGTVFPNVHQNWNQSESKGGKGREEEFSFADSGEETEEAPATNKKAGTRSSKKKTKNTGKKTGKATLHSANSRSRSSRRSERNNPWINY
ncbi:LysM peptidoglycan-binding domain-containing protein [Paenibacillus senegalensis]|uniref:LysM peptidoglycan-binding domain-containing protein n=1 Tax=Paenibacillus senegalensis TaxID=1465766 RepID=UPI00028A1601|nr:LysM peptidoglycan-binding domain-containing protein [Paenibacillus senegalensis]